MTTLGNGSAAAGGDGGAAAAAAAAAAGNPDASANNGAAPGNGTDGGNNGAASDPFTGLQAAENRDLVKNKGWANPDAALASYRELESRLGKAILPPDANATPEQRAAFYEKLGRPKTPTEYKFERPKGLPETYPYDATEAEHLKTIFHDAGLTPAQAGAVHDALAITAASNHDRRLAQTSQDVQAAQVKIVEKWGEEGGEKYKRNVELATRAIRNLGGDDLLADLKATGFLTKDGTVTKPSMAFALAKIGEQLFSEDAIYSDIGGFQNPFAVGTENITEQGKIIRSDPEKAKALIRAAGIDVKEYFPGG